VYRIVAAGIRVSSPRRHEQRCGEHGSQQRPNVTAADDGRET
jgi:hypothetical protein